MKHTSVAVVAKETVEREPSKRLRKDGIGDKGYGPFDSGRGSVISHRESDGQLVLAGTMSRFPNRVAAEVTRLKPQWNQTLLPSAHTCYKAAHDLQNSLQLFSALSSVVGGGHEASARECGAALRRNQVIGRPDESCVVAGHRGRRGEKPVTGLKN